jgi:hypothetical protein
MLFYFCALTLFLGAKVVNMDIKFPLMDEDSVVEMYEAFLTKHPEVKLAVVGKID